MEVNGYVIEPGVDLIWANLYRVDLSGANLEAAKIEAANLYRANLEGANLEGANLKGANLYAANLTKANLEGATLEGANLTAAKANEDTTWPEGFDPVAAGVIFN